MNNHLMPAAAIACVTQKVNVGVSDIIGVSREARLRNV
jgi:hypothetical protein